MAHSRGRARSRDSTRARVKNREVKLSTVGQVRVARDQEGRKDQDRDQTLCPLIGERARAVGWLERVIGQMAGIGVRKCDLEDVTRIHAVLSKSGMNDAA